ncbi:MAG: hypothetical protein AAB885_02165 [Patescibacteria group bacterium]
MGHYASEMDSIGNNRYFDRLFKLRNKLQNMPLSSFTVGDFEALYRVMGIDIDKNAHEEDLVRLERKVQKKRK